VYGEQRRLRPDSSLPAGSFGYLGRLGGWGLLRLVGSW
jgi:hypothetical protein